MRILFDQGTPVPLRAELAGHYEVATAFEKGWAELGNGELLKLAEAEFDVLVSTDQNLRYQQDLTRYRLAVVVLTTTSSPRIQRDVRRVLDALSEVRPGEYREVAFPAS